MTKRAFGLFPLAGYIVFSMASAGFAAEGTVRIWEEKLVLPTYLVDPPEPAPIFFLAGPILPRESQGREGRRDRHPRSPGRRGGTGDSGNGHPAGSGPRPGDRRGGRALEIRADGRRRPPQGIGPEGDGELPDDEGRNVLLLQKVRPAAGQSPRARPVVITQLKLD